MRVVKAHAYGNDFLLMPEQEMAPDADRAAVARQLCDRHHGIGADGLITFADGPRGARMQLLNADGSYSEVSGNGVRCLAAWLARTRSMRPRQSVEIETDAGAKMLELLEMDGRRLTFRAEMGQPENVRQQTIDVDGSPVDAVTLRVGNPQCVVLGDAAGLTEERLNSVASKLAVHPAFPQGTNVELAAVEAPDRVRILIWERGAGPTQASGTGACAAAVAAMRFGGAARDVSVSAPGGTQRVEWQAEGLFLTGWAEVLFEASW